MPRQRLVEAEARALTEQISWKIAQLQNAGWSQQQFAERLNVSVRWVSLIERGRQNLTIHTLVRVARSLDAEPRELWDPPQSAPAPSNRGRSRDRARKRSR